MGSSFVRLSVRSVGWSIGLSFVRSVGRLVGGSLIGSLVRSVGRSVVHWLVRFFVLSFVRLFVRSFTREHFDNLILIVFVSVGCRCSSNYWCDCTVNSCYTTSYSIFQTPTRRSKVLKLV